MPIRFDSAAIADLWDVNEKATFVEGVAGVLFFAVCCLVILGLIGKWLIEAEKSSLDQGGPESEKPNDGEKQQADDASNFAIVTRPLKPRAEESDYRAEADGDDAQAGELSSHVPIDTTEREEREDSSKKN